MSKEKIQYRKKKIYIYRKYKKPYKFTCFSIYHAKKHMNSYALCKVLLNLCTVALAQAHGYPHIPAAPGH